MQLTFKLGRFCLSSLSLQVNVRSCLVNLIKLNLFAISIILFPECKSETLFAEG